MSSRRRRSISLIVLTWFSWTSVVWSADDPFSLFEEEAKVTTASRREQPINESPVAIDVITADDIAASKALNIWDLLRYRTGMDVIETRTINDNRAIVSVRGFGEEFNNNLQVLVDGRSVFQGAFGGLLWEQMPVQIQDIDRIEIVRGPNAALYGSNAGLGVINILTKKPSGRSAAVGGYLGSRDLDGSREAVETTGTNYGLRFSHSYQGSEGLLSSDGTEQVDNMHSNKVNARAFWNPTEKSKLELMTGVSYDHLVNAGANVAFIFGNAPTLDFRDHFQQLKYTLATGQNSSLEVMGARRDTSVESASREYQYDAEALEHMQWAGGRSNTTVGASYRSYNAYFPFLFSAQTPHQRNELTRAFVQQSWRPFDKLILTGAASNDRTTQFGSEPAFQGAVVTPLSENHTFRVSYGVSSTLPSIIDKRLNGQIPFPPFGTVTVQGDPSIEPSRISSFEASHLGSFLNHRVDTEVTGFYMTLRDIPSLIQVNPLLSVYRNANEAIARGVETKVSYRFARNRSVYANYWYESISDQLDVYGPATPDHTLNVGAFTPIGRGFSASFDAGYNNHYTAISALGRTGIPAFIRLDARLAYQRGNVEVYVAGKNLTRPFKQEYAGTTLATPRVIYSGIDVHFGDKNTPLSGPR